MSNDNNEMSLQDRINELFEENSNKKNADLARAAKVSRATITDWRNGDTKTIAGENAFAVAKFFNVNAEWVQTGKGPKRDREVTNDEIARHKLQHINEAAGEWSISAQKDTKLKVKSIAWSIFCLDTSSINTAKELVSMIIESDIEVSKNAYIIEIDCNIFPDFPAGDQLLIDPEATPRKNSTVLMSIGDEIPTLVRWNPGLGELQAEPLESGYPNSISLKNKTYTILGVAIQAQQKARRL